MSENEISEVTDRINSKKDIAKQALIRKVSSFFMNKDDPDEAKKEHSIQQLLINGADSSRADLD